MGTSDADQLLVLQLASPRPSADQVIPQGVTPSPCIACCLVITDDRLFTCHEDCQTSFFRSLGTAVLADISGVSTEPGREYCILVSVCVWGGWPRREHCLLTGPSPQEFSRDGQQPLPPWVVYLSCTSELDRFLSALSSGWRTIYQVPGAQGPRGRAVPRVAQMEAGLGGLGHTIPVAPGQTRAFRAKGQP